MFSMGEKNPVIYLVQNEIERVEQQIEHARQAIERWGKQAEHELEVKAMSEDYLKELRRSLELLRAE